MKGNSLRWLVPPPKTSRLALAGATVPLSIRLVGLPEVLYPAETLSRGYCVSRPLYSTATTPPEVMLPPEGPINVTVTTSLRGLELVIFLA